MSYSQYMKHWKNHRKDKYYQQCGGSTSMFIEEKILTDMDRFKNRVKNCEGIWESDNVYFYRMRDGYYADYKPKYPEKSCGDYTIYENPLQHKIFLYALNATEFGTIKKEYSNWNEVWADFKNCEQ